MKYSYLLIALVVFLKTEIVNAQCVPISVNLTGSSEATWTSPPGTNRDQKCCSNNQYNCVQFLITLDPGTAGLLFTYDGAPAFGSERWQLNCDGIEHSLRDTICLSGVGPHSVTFCKPGANTGNYIITTISKPIFPPDDTTRLGCSLQLVSHGIKAGTASWTSISPGAMGTYNSYLSCLTCPSPTITPAPYAPDFVDYKVCGSPIASMCGYTQTICDTVRVYFRDSLKANVNPNPAAFCSGGGGVLLNGIVTGGDNSYTYVWTNSSGTTLSTTSNYNATVQGTYTLQVKDRFFSNTCPAVFVNSPVTVGTPPVVNAGPDKNLCSNVTKVVLNGSITNAATGIWSGGGGTYFPNNTSLALQYTPTAAEIASGSVTLTLTSTGAGGGCANTSDQVKLIFSPPVQITAGNINLNCYNSTTSISPVVTGGTSPFQYYWSNGATTNAVTNVNTGNYCLQVTDAIGCTSSKCINVSAPAPISIVTSAIDVTANGGSNGTAIASASGGVAPYTYTWNTAPAQINDSAANLSYGIYQVTVKDFNNCIKTASVVVNEPRCLNLQGAVTTTANICYGGESGTATVTVNGGTAPYTYLWDDRFAQTTATAITLTGGVFTVRIRDANGCYDLVSATINQPAQLNLTLNHTNIAIVGSGTGSASAIVSGGTGPYTYNWNTGAGTSSINNLAAGVYSVIVRDFNNCQVTDSVKINEGSCASFHVFVNKTNVSCSNGSNGSAGLVIFGGVRPFTYLWNNGSTDSTLANLAPGNYSVLVRDAINCNNFATFTIQQPAPISLSLAATNVSCGNNDGSIDLTVAGGTFPYTFNWSNGVAVEDLVYLSAAAGGTTYTVNVTDNKGCIKSASVVLTQPPALTLTASMVSNLCYNGSQGSINLSVSGGTVPYSYLWSNGATTEDLSGLSSGSYSVTVTDANNCITQLQNPFFISQPNQIVITITNVLPVSCRGQSTGSATASVTGGSGNYQYQWNDAASQVNSTATNLMAGTYTVTIYDLNGCSIPVTKSVTITQPAAVLNASIVTDSVNCFGGSNGSAVVTASGGTSPYTYLWNFNSVTGNTLSNVGIGNYSVTVTDVKGCQKIVSAVINQPADISISVLSVTNVSCFGNATGAASVSVSGGVPAYTYSWSGGQTAASISNLAAGVYIITVKDAKLCQKQGSIAITQPVAPLNAVTNQVNINCFGNSTGSAGVTVTGGTSPYSYLWNTGNTTSSINGISSGTYQVMITDAKGCTLNKSFSITQPSAALGGSLNITDNLCNGTSVGQISSNISGGTSPYFYSWNTGSSLTGISNLPAGMYTLNVADSKGCSINLSGNVNQPSPVQITANVMNSECGLASADTSGKIALTVTGGVGPYTYSWTGPAGYSSAAQNIISLTSGTYVVTVTDNNGCIKTHTSVVSKPGTLVINGVVSVYTGGGNVSCYNSTDGSIDITVAGGISPLSYSWLLPDNSVVTSEDLSDIGAGEYILIVTDANGCYADSSFMLTQPDQLTVSTTSLIYNGGFNVSCFGASNGSINAVVAGGIADYDYLWTGPNGFNADTEDISGLVAGSYTLIVTDTNLCTTGKTVVLTQPQPLSVNLTASSYSGGYNISCSGSSDGTINAVLSGGSLSGYTVIWTFNGINYQTSGLVSSGLAAGVYTLAVTDNNGCTVIDSINLIQPDPLTIDFVSGIYNGAVNISCYGLNDGSITGLVNGGDQGSYQYTWSSNGLTIATATNSINQLAAGDYQLLVADSNGCSVLQSVTLTQPGPLSATSVLSDFNGYNVSCSGSSNGSLDVTVAGGSAPYNYSWSNSSGFLNNLEDQTNISASTYTLTVTDTNSCSFVYQQTLNEPPLLGGILNSTIYMEGYNISCNGFNNGGISLNTYGGSGENVYSWTGPNGYTSSSQSVSGLFAGIYQVLIRDNNGCTLSLSAALNQPDPIVAVLTSPDYNGVNVSCNGFSNGSINLTVSGGTSSLGYTYQWTGPNSFSSNLQYLNGLTVGLYTVTVTDQNGCSVSESIILTLPNSIINIDSLTNYNGYGISCHGFSNGTIYTNVSGGIAPYEYLWTDQNLNVISVNDSLQNVQAGVYHLEVSDINGCLSLSTYTLTEPDAISGNISAPLFNGYEISCYGSNNGSIINNLSGGVPPLVFEWTDHNNFTSPVAAPLDLFAGWFYLQTTDMNGCVKNDSILLSQPSVLMINDSLSIYNGFNTSCFNSANATINLMVSGSVGPYQFDWSEVGGTYTSTDQNISGIGAGIYQVTVTDLNGCNQLITHEIISPEPLVGIALAQNVKCYNGSTGNITYAISGGVSPYGYSWNTGSTSNVLSNITAGTYIITTTDANSCTVTDTVVINQPDSLIISKTLSDFNGYNVSCFNSSNGSININVEGGTMPYTYSWSNSQSAPNISGLAAGTYILTVRDSNNCTATLTQVISQPDSISGILISSNYNGFGVKCFNDANGNIQSAVTGGAAPYTYLWSFNSATGTGISGIQAGTYTLQVTDHNNCVKTYTATITQPDAILLSYTTISTLCNGNNGSIDLTVTGGAMPYQYLWSNGAAGQDLNNVYAGSYTVLVIDVNGCNKTIDALINKVGSIGISAAINNILCYGTKTGSISVVPYSGKGPFSYTWSTGANTSSIIDLSGGTYNVTVSDSNGCSIDTAFMVNENPPIIISGQISVYFDQYGVSTYNGNDGTVDITLTGGVSPYTFSWSNGSQLEDITNLGPGSYTVVLTDNVGCKATYTTSLTEPGILEMPNGYTPNNDGANDMFVIHGVDAYPNNKFTVFNRWGNIVYEKETYNNEWNGFNNSNKELPEGTYFVILEINNGEIVLKGYVDLRR